MGKTKFAPLLAGIGFCLAAISPASATVMGTVTVDNPTDLTISLSGTIDGPLPAGFENWFLIYLNSGATVNFVGPQTGTGNLAIGGNSLGDVYVDNSLGGPHIEMNFISAITVGATVSGTQTLSFGSAHGVTAADLMGASLYHGWANSDITQGTFQGYVNADSVAEPGTLAILSIGLAGFGVARRRRKAA